MPFEVEAGVPIPGSAFRTAQKKYPWEDMKVGDSFFVENSGQKRDSVDSAAHYAGKTLGRKFAVRRVEGGWRVWRVE